MYRNREFKPMFKPNPPHSSAKIQSGQYKAALTDIVYISIQKSCYAEEIGVACDDSPL